jgi:hypothetical protein
VEVVSTDTARVEAGTAPVDRLPEPEAAEEVAVESVEAPIRRFLSADRVDVCS